MHLCLPEDLDQFYPPTKRDEKKFNSLQLENKGLFCLDELDLVGKPYDLNIFSPNDTDLHRRLDLTFLPCIPI